MQQSRVPHLNAAERFKPDRKNKTPAAPGDRGFLN
jgi:hypothetical protein